MSYQIKSTQATLWKRSFISANSRDWKSMYREYKNCMPKLQEKRALTHLVAKWTKEWCSELKCLENLIPFCLYNRSMLHALQITYLLFHEAAGFGDWSGSSVWRSWALPSAIWSEYELMTGNTSGKLPGFSIDQTLCTSAICLTSIGTWLLPKFIIDQQSHGQGRINISWHIILVLTSENEKHTTPTSKIDCYNSFRRCVYHTNSYSFQTHLWNVTDCVSWAVDYNLPTLPYLACN